MADKEPVVELGPFSSVGAVPTSWRQACCELGPAERKAKNLSRNPWCAITTGQNSLDGLHLVVEGAAASVGDGDERHLVVEAFESKYGSQFTAPEPTWFGLGDAIRGDALVYGVTPSQVFGFGKGEQYSQTRFRFSEDERIQR